MSQYIPSGSDEPRPSIAAIEHRHFACMRVFVPAREFIGSTRVRTQVDHWYWHKRHGLRCVYRDGLDWRSEYTLPELLKTEQVVEVR